MKHRIEKSHATLAATFTATFAFVVAGPFAAWAQTNDPLINEFVANHTGTDTFEYVEVLGGPSVDYSALTVLQIEGDASGAGTIDSVLPVGTTDASGYWTTGFLNNEIENGTITLLLVEGFTGSAGDDLDTDNDGVLDVTPWERVVDDVAVFDGGADDRTYASTVLVPGFDGLNSFTPGGASRIPNGTDTDMLDDWLRNDFDLFGLPAQSGTPEVGEAANTPGTENLAITVETDPVGACFDAATKIHFIQGSGAASDDVGSIREVEGVVVGDFQGATGLGGFFVQEEDADADGDPATSEGIFVFDPANTIPVAEGDVVRVRGRVEEFFGLTRLDDVQTVLDCQTTDTASPSTLILPVPSLADFEAVEGMSVDLPQTLFASGNFNQGRFGEVDLAVGGPLDNPTNVATPGPDALAVRDLNDRSRIQLDDGSSVQNPLPLPPYIGEGSTLRTGDSVDGVSGVLSFAFGAYEIHPTVPVETIRFTRNNVRPAVPDVGGSLTVGAFNVLNYFTTLTGAGSVCGPSMDQDCRGADNSEELARQRAKLVSAISQLDADVLGLIEIENNVTDEPTADLVEGINDVVGAGTYDYIATGAIGTDAIRVAIVYKPATVAPVGSYAILDSSVDPRFIDTKNRPVLAQSFFDRITGATFTVAVNHLKSKGSSCDDVGDPDTGDLQGNCNLTRTNAAQAQVEWLATDPTSSGSDGFLIVGDLNAYAQEDPVTTLEAGGYTDLIKLFVGRSFADGAYSFNFFSESGYLDHGLASTGLLSQVTGAAFWHVNADEPRALDYNDFNQPALFNPDEFRASDHDAVIVGLELAPPTPENKDDCKNGGWMRLRGPDGSPFRNQGQCIKLVNTGR